jgi:cytidine deaminase
VCYTRDMEKTEFITDKEERKLRIKAQQVYRNSYCPYSGLQVGASVLTDNGQMYSGTNIENTSFGLTMCAERVAVFSALSAGDSSIRAICIHTPTSVPVRMCGACLQVLSDHLYKGDLWIINTCNSEEEYSGFLSEQYNGKFTNDRFTFTF